MKLPKRPTEEFKHTLDAHEKIDNAPEFTLKPLTVGKFDEVLNLTTAGKQITGYRMACLYGIKNWENLEPEFNEATLVDSLTRFPVEWLVELANKILDSSAVKEPEKNS